MPAAHRLAFAHRLDNISDAMMYASLTARRGASPPIVTCLVLAAGLLAGCGSERVSLSPTQAPSAVLAAGKAAPSAAAGRGEALEVFKEMQRRQDAVQSVVARVSAVLKDEHRDKQWELNGAYLADRDGNSRFRLLHGETAILDFVTRGDTVEVWLPRKDRFLRGTRKDIYEADESSGGPELMLMLLASDPRDLLFARGCANLPLEKGKVERKDGKDEVRFWRLQGTPGVGGLCVLLSNDVPAAERVDFFAPRGARLLGSIQYEEYSSLTFTPAGTLASPPKAMYYPGRVTLLAPSGDKQLRLGIEELRLNEPVPAAKFQIALPEGQAVLDLGEQLRSGKGLWE